MSEEITLFPTGAPHHSVSQSTALAPPGYRLGDRLISRPRFKNPRIIEIETAHEGGGGGAMGNPPHLHVKSVIVSNHRRNLDNSDRPPPPPISPVVCGGRDRTWLLARAGCTAPATG